MGLFGGQFSSVVEWKEYSDDIIFWKFPSSEIKKGSRSDYSSGTGCDLYV